MIKFSENISNQIIKDYIPEHITSVLVECGVWLAGGALRCCFNTGDNLVDYDLFFRSHIDFAQTKLHFEKLEDCELYFQCPQGKLTTFKYKNTKIQLISEFYYPNISELLNSFDITACRHAYDGKHVYSFYSSIRDSVKMKINLHAINFPVATLKRVLKYTNKGYTLTNKSAIMFVDHIYSLGVEGKEINKRIYVD